MKQNDPTPSVAAANEALTSTLPFADTADFDAVERGFLGTLDDPAIRNEAGEVVWDASTYDFLQGDAPSTVNPSLWRQSKLVAKHGLFEVVEGIYQARGLDLSVMSFIEGDDGRDRGGPADLSGDGCCGPRAVPQAPRRPPDHRRDLHAQPHRSLRRCARHRRPGRGRFAGTVQIVAPEGFLEHAIAENVYAGTAMVASLRLHVRCGARARPAGQVGRGPRADDLDRPGGHHGPDDSRSPPPERSTRSTGSSSNSRWRREPRRRRRCTSTCRAIGRCAWRRTRRTTCTTC